MWLSQAAPPVCSLRSAVTPWKQKDRLGEQKDSSPVSLEWSSFYFQQFDYFLQMKEQKHIYLEANIALNIEDTRHLGFPSRNFFQRLQLVLPKIPQTRASVNMTQTIWKL